MSEELHLHQTEMGTQESLIFVHILLKNYLPQHQGEPEQHICLSEHNIKRRKWILVPEDACNRKLKTLKKMFICSLTNEKN